MKIQSNIGIVFLAAFISCVVGFINHYPLVYPDTGSYIYSGFSNLVFDDRPIFYGLFLRHISMATSLWFIIIMQGLLICCMIYITLGMFFRAKKRNYVFVAIIIFITLTTGFSYTVSILIPDIFSSISILCLINLMLNKNLNKFHKVTISILFIFSVCTQFSSLPIMITLFGLLALIYFLKKIIKMPIEFSPRRLFLSFILFVSCLFIIPSVHYLFNKQFKISGATHVFIMNHLLEIGVLHDYLETACLNHNYKICQYKDKLGWDFIWSDESPVQKTGGWKANEIEYNAIIREVFTTPKYIVILVEKGIEYSLRQLVTFNISVSPPQLNGSAPFSQISWRFPNTIKEYDSSLQSQEKLEIGFMNVLQQIVIIISISILISVMVTSLFKKLSVEIRWSVLIIVAYSIFNSMTCSNFSTIDPRFQSRIIWLLPFLAIVIIIKLIELRPNKSGKVEVKI